MTPWTVAPPRLLFPWEEYRTFPSPRDLPNPGIDPAAAARQADSLPLSRQGSLSALLCVPPATVKRAPLFSSSPALAVVSALDLDFQTCVQWCLHLPEASEGWLCSRHCRWGSHFILTKILLSKSYDFIFPPHREGSSGWEKIASLATAP